jgi:hydrogenase maturation protein HypF
MKISNAPRISNMCRCPVERPQSGNRGGWRSAIWRITSDAEFLKLGHPVRSRNLIGARLTFLRMMEQGVNSPLTSSCGRLFDAVAALAGIRQQVNYEAQAAIELEMAMVMTESENTPYPLKLLPDVDHWIISTRPMFEALLDDLGRNVPIGTISRRFHNGLVECFVELATLLRAKTCLHRVCLSGGTFHNIYLCNGSRRAYPKLDLKCSRRSKCPPATAA